MEREAASDTKEKKHRGEKLKIEQVHRKRQKGRGGEKFVVRDWKRKTGN